MDIKLSLIKEIEESKIMFDGCAYVIEDESENIGINSMMKYSFDSVINNIVENYDKEESFKSVNKIHEDITEYLDSTKDVKKTIILLPDNGLRGVDKVNYNLNSLFYFKISDNFGLGFLVNKTLSEFLSQNLKFVEKQ